MVSANPLFVGRWTVKKFKATVINDIWPEVLFFTLVATTVALVSTHTKAKLGVSPQLLTVLGTVLGLVISFRTSTAYERYSEGRKMWSTISLTSRNISQLIWIHVPSERVNKEDPTKSKPTLEGVIEKKTMVNLVQAFSVSVKHMLRAEPGIYYEDLYPLVCFLPKYAYQPTGQMDLLPLWQASLSHGIDGTTPKPVHPRSSTMPPPSTQTGHYFDEAAAEKSYWYKSHRNKRRGSFDPEKVLPEVVSEYPLKPARNPPNRGFFDYFTILRPLRSFAKFLRRKVRKGTKPMELLNEERAPLTPESSAPSKRERRANPMDSNVPMEIALYLSSYLAFLLKNGLLTPAIATAMTNNLILIQDSVFSLDRIRSTPLPFAYQAHLRLSLWIYLMLLPFQLYNAFGYLTIPATTFASFLLVGFLEIGQEIENPFNYDLNDLDLDHFCLAIQRELHEITAHPTSSTPDSYIFTRYNQPFAPGDRRTAENMMADVDHEYHGAETGVDSIKRTLLHSWRAVDFDTRPQNNYI